MTVEYNPRRQTIGSFEWTTSSRKGSPSGSPARWRLDSATVRKFDHRDSKSEEDRKRDIIVITNVVKYIECLEPKSRVAIRIQLLSLFIEAFFPSSQAQSMLMASESIVALLPQRINANGMLGIAIDALCFAHLACTTGQNVFQEKAMIYFGSTISALQKVLGSAATPDIEDVLLTIIVLSMPACQALQKAESSNLGWSSHYLGAQSFLCAAGPRCLNVLPSVRPSVYKMLGVWAYWLGIARRKPAITGVIKWLKTPCPGHWTNRGPHIYAAQSARHLPALVSEAENLVQGVSPASKWRGVRDKLKTSRERLIEDYVKVLNGQAFFYSEGVVSHAIEHTGTPNDIQLFITHSDVFPIYYRFDDLDTLDIFMLHSISSLILECTAIRIFTLGKKTDLSELEAPLHVEAEQNAYDRAMDICKTLFSFSVSDNVPRTALMAMGVEMSRNFFLETGNIKEANWCKNVRCILDDRMEAVKTKQRLSLCRAPDLVPYIASIGRFREKYPVVLQ